MGTILLLKLNPEPSVAIMPLGTGVSHTLFSVGHLTLKLLILPNCWYYKHRPHAVGNDLSRTFGWGAAFDNAWIKSHENMFFTLKRVSSREGELVEVAYQDVRTSTYFSLCAHQHQIAVSKTENLDCWNITLTLPKAELLNKLPYSVSRLPADPAASEMISAGGMFW